MQLVSAHPRLILLAAVLAALGLLALVPITRAPQSLPTWERVDALVKDQKLEEASRQVELILRAAQKRKDEAEWTKALIREVQLRMGLHGYETAVRFLKDEPWPQGLLSRTTLELFYAHALVQYAQMYSWEIGKREKVESSGPVDLKAWTREQILSEAERAYGSVWKNREALGSMPVGRLSEYVEPNNYPPDVRGTLRDAVSYLFVDLLANSSFWTPAQSNDVALLAVPALLEAAGPVAEARVVDPSVHPIERLVAVLGDLESWHAAGKQAAAALEARLERLRRLHAALSEEPSRAAIRKDLETRLPAFRDIDWWSMGQAQLALFRQTEDAPDNLIRAREAALEGPRAYPKSVGAQLCNSLIATIESPDSQMAAMSSDGLDRRSIELTHKNLSSLSFRAYAIDLERRIEAAQNYNLMPQGEEVRELLQSARPVAQWSTSLPPTPDYKPHRTFVTPPIRSAGLYLVVSSVRDDFALKNNRIDSVAILLGDLVLVTRPQPSTIEARVLSGETGQPVPGAEVMLYAYDWSRGRGHHRIESKLTDADGGARFDYAPGRAEGNLFLVARDRTDYALDPSAMSMFKPQKAEEAFGALIYTDRSIYRPQQKILWKVLAYRGRADLGKLSVAPETFVTVSLHDANGEVVEKKSLPTNTFGSAAGEFVIPGGRALGAWHLESSFSGNASVQVEEYKRPTFEVTWSDPAAPLRLNQPAVLSGTARYYFGLPVSSGRVRWRVKRLPQYPPWWWWGRFAPHVGEQIVAQGESPLKEDGTFEARFTPAASEESGRDARQITYRYEAAADVTDEGGETRSTERAFRLGFVSVEAAVRMDAGFFREGVGGSVVITRSDLDGSPRAGRGSWRLTAIVEPEKTLLPAEMPPQRPVEDRFATPGDRLRPRWDTNIALEATLRGWPDGAEKARGDLTHDARGEAPVALPALAAGAWRLHYETRDEFGATFETTKDFLVAGRRMPVKFPGVLLAEHSSVAAGERARLLAFSGLPGQSFSVETLRDGEVTSRRSLSGSDDSLLEMPVGDADRGGFGVRLTLLADHQLIDLTQAVFVPWDDKELKVSFATFRDKIRPGARETWRVTVQAPPGTPAEARAAELLASMYDRSLDAFLPYDPPGRAQPLPEPHVGRVRSREPRRGSRAVDRSRRLRPESFGPGPPWRLPQVRRRIRHRGTRRPAPHAREVADGVGLRCGRALARGDGRRGRRRGWRRRRGFRRRSRTDRRAEGDCRKPGSQERGPRPGRVAAQQFFRDGVLDPAAPDRRGRLGGHRVPGTRFRHVLERLGACGDAGPEGRLRAQGDPKRQGSDGPPVRASLPARGGHGAAEGRRQQRIVSRDGGPGPARNPRCRNQHERPCAVRADPREGDASLQRPPRRGRRRHVRADGSQTGRLVLDPGDGRLGRSLGWGAASRPRAAWPHAAFAVALRDAERRRAAHDELRGHGQRRRPEPHRRAAGRHGRRPALLLGAQRAPVPGELSLRVHGADTESLRVDRDRVGSLPRLPGRREDGAGALEARDPARGLGGGGSQSQDGAGRDALARDGPRRQGRRQRDDQRPRSSHRKGAARDGAGEAPEGADVDRRLPVVAGRPAVAVHDALHPVRPGESLGVRRRCAEGHGAKGWGYLAAQFRSEYASGWRKTSATGSG